MACCYCCCTSFSLGWALAVVAAPAAASAVTAALVAVPTASSAATAALTTIPSASDTAAASTAFLRA